VHPELWQWGPIHLRSYGVMLAIAFLVGTWIATREARRLRLDEDRVVTMILVTLVAGVLGARLLYVLEHVDEFRREWGSVFALWQGGLTLYGGVVAGTLGGLLTARRLGLPMWLAADALTPSVALGTMFGRVGCFLNGCCYGRPTRMPWGVVFPPDSYAGVEFGSARLPPSQLYAAFAGLVLFLIFWALRTRVRVPGVLFWSFIAAFAVVRIGIDFTRAWERDAQVFSIGQVPITESQVTSGLLILFATLMILRLRRTAWSPASPPPRPGGPAPAERVSSSSPRG
jgi:phosphatidylglycerol---prolipoprotein diacylglyceryl transferase